MNEWKYSVSYQTQIGNRMSNDEARHKMTSNEELISQDNQIVI